MLLILAGVTIAMLTGSDSAPAKANEAKQANDVGTEQDAMALVVSNAQMDAYDDVYVKNNSTVTQSQASTSVGQKVIDEVLKHYGGTARGTSTEKITRETTKGNVTVKIEQENGKDAKITIKTTDIEKTGAISIKGGSLSWGTSGGGSVSTKQWEIDQDNDSSGTLTVGDLVAPTIASVSNEKFYVIGKDDTEGTVTLLSQYCVDWKTANAQDATMGIYDEDEYVTTGTLAFIADSSAANANVYSASDIKGKVDAYASKLVTAGLTLEDVEVVENGTPVAGIKGRLMWGTDSSGEVQSILGSSLTNKNDIVYGPTGAKLNYWLGSPVGNYTNRAWFVIGYEDVYYDYVSNDDEFGLRPVIKVLQSNF